MGLERDVAALSVLVEPRRRQLYDAVASAPTPRTLSELARELEIGRTLAAFHLGKLTEAGLVEVVPAATVVGQRGRPSRRFRTSSAEVSASLPARRYDLVAEVLLAAASDQQPGEPLEAAARRTGRARGAELARGIEPGRRSGSRRRIELVLSALGYAPRRDGQVLVLRNCPFSRLREVDLGMVCGINHALAEGYVDGVGAADELTAVLAPCEGNCCVVVRPAASRR